MLDTLPCEILTMIADWLPPASLRALGRVSSGLYSVLVPQLYRAVTFRAASEWALNVLDVDSFLLHHGHSGTTSFLQHTRHLYIQAPIHLARFNRCAYYNIFRTAGLAQGPSTLGAADETRAHEQFLNDTADQLHVVLAQLKPDSLRTFQWRLGTCIPAGVLDEGGYLSRHQKRLTCLSLVTDGTCPHARHHLNGLSQLSSLTKLEWEGIQHPAEVESLRQCIRRNRKHLTDLSIGFVLSPNARSLRWDVLGLRWPGAGPCDEDESIPFPPLSILSLYKVSLSGDLRDYSSFRSLQALSLRDCPNVLRFLRSLSGSRSTLNLREFELCCDFLLHEPDDDYEFSSVVRFLFSFRGLQHLRLRLSNFPELGFRVEDAIRHHRPTLESLVYHQRQLAPIDNEGLFEDDRDVSPDWIPGLPAIVDLCRVTTLALCTSPSAARMCLQPAAAYSTLQVLHLRFSGAERIHRDIRHEVLALLRKRRSGCPPTDHVDEVAEIPVYSGGESDHVEMDTPSAPSETEDFVAFAEWAFGPSGLPALQVLAFGDFSHNDRYPGQQFLVRRKGQPGQCSGKGSDPSVCNNPNGFPFCPASMDDPSIWDRVSLDGARLLTACPGGGLIESPYEL
ncbi:hypothetical protein NUU61_001520 [Penicillium alfredii]|uniref:F-box domain-containing protein n=1 Tax=Penicillium alfredii TaxID=1506179 RepID=A0A9W9G583_9EURO|nr:uncharacterized protein NUU61_001520 [Penicillium alfredii]KAJ5111890.1 hypothetical protein NUU61_001520 [Penicillium alfredii]